MAHGDINTYTLEELESLLSACRSDIVHCLDCSAIWEISGCGGVECPACNPTDDEDIPGSSVWADEYATDSVLEGYLA